MKAITLNKKSWHYRLATTYGPFNKYDRWGDFDYSRMNICDYVRSVFIGLLFVVLITLILGAFAAIVADFGAWVIAMISIEQLILPEAGAILVSGIICGILMFAAIRGIVIGTKKLINRFAVPDYNDDSFIGSAYESFKNKICFTIEFKE